MYLIGLAGKKESGKTTTANYIRDLILNVNPEAEIHILNFADPLKEEVAKACEVTVDFIEKNKPKFRTILQWWGTEFRREMFGSDYWVEKFLTKVKTLNNNAIVIVGDIRFLNEVNTIRYVGGKLWKLTRKSSNTNQDSHKSETELDSVVFWDAVIDNSQSLGYLRGTISVELEKARFLKS